MNKFYFKLNSAGENLLIREDSKKGVYVEGLLEEITRNTTEAMDILKKGWQNKHIGQTSMNFESSRSHSVFTIFIESKVILFKCYYNFLLKILLILI